MIFSLIAILLTSDARAGTEKVSICHATSSETNPYTQNDVDASSIDNEKNRYLNGHGDHEKDIIPPFSYGSSSFGGKNWDDKGKEIWSNGCNIVMPTPTVTPTPTDTPTPTVTPTPTDTPTPSITPTPSVTIYPTPSETTETPIIITPEPTRTIDPVIKPTDIPVPNVTPIVPTPQPTIIKSPTPKPFPTRIDAGGGGMVEIPFLR